MSRRVALRALGCVLIGLAVLLATRAVVFVPEASACLPGFKPKPGVTNPTDNERDCEPESGPASPPAPLPGETAAPPEPKRPPRPAIVDPKAQRKKVEDFLKKPPGGEGSGEQPRPTAPPPVKGDGTDEAIGRLGEKLRKGLLVVPEKPCQRLTQARQQAREKKDECEALRRELEEKKKRLRASENTLGSLGKHSGSIEEASRLITEVQKEIRELREAIGELVRKLRECEEAQARIDGEIVKLPGCGEEKPGPTAGPVEGGKGGGETGESPPKVAAKAGCDGGKSKEGETAVLRIPTPCKRMVQSPRPQIKIKAKNLYGAYYAAGSTRLLSDLLSCAEALSDYKTPLLDICAKLGTAAAKGIEILEPLVTDRGVVGIELTAVYYAEEGYCDCLSKRICRNGEWHEVPPLQLDSKSCALSNPRRETISEDRETNFQSYSADLRQLMTILLSQLPPAECGCSAR